MKLFTCISVVSTATALTWIGWMWFNNYVKCSTIHIHKTCQDYLGNNITYNKLCESICVKKDFDIRQCLFSTTFNKSVFLATIKGMQTVLKVDIQWFNRVKEAEESLLNQTMFNLTNYFAQIVFQYFGDNCSNCGKLVAKLLTMADADSNGIVSPREAIRFGSLLLNRETFMLTALNETNSTVDFYGYCGALYTVEKVHMANSVLIDTSTAFTDFWSLPEFAEPLESFFKDILGEMRESYPTFLALHEYIYIFFKKLKKDSVPSLEQRLDYVIGMIGLVYEFVSFDYGEILLCDTLYSNFGFSDLSNFSIVKLIDFDEVFGAAKAFHGVTGKHCSSNNDCRIGVNDVGIHYHEECSSFCQESGFCNQDYLAFLCNGMFFDVFFNPVTIGLSEQDLPNKVALLIIDILKECGRPILHANIDEHLVHIQKVADKFHNVKQLIKT